MKRTFIALDIIPDILLKEAIETIRQKLRGERISWTQTDSLHLTLKFLGDTPEEQIPLITKALAQTIMPFSPFKINLEGIGVFKNIHDPRVLWVGCRVDNQLPNLRDKIDSTLASLGFQNETRDFSPHITLGRIKMIRQIYSLSEILTTYKNKVFQESLINEVIFYESRLQPAGAVYTVIEKFTAHPSQS